MKQINYFTKYTIVLFLIGCSSAPEESVEMEFTHDSFANTIELKGTQVNIEGIINPYEAYVVNDTLLLVSNIDPAQKDKVKLFSLNDGRIISSFVQKGHADNEVISCNIKYLSTEDDLFYIDDVVQNKYWACSIDSLCAQRKGFVSSFYYSRDVISIYPLDSTYIGFNFWYLDDKKYNNGINSPIEEFSINNYQAKSRSSDFDYFVANVTGAVITRNPVNKDIWVAYNHDNIIQIYDKDFKLKKQMNGPEQPERKYQTRTIKGKEYVFFEKDSYISCYHMSVATPKHIYLLYENINNIPFPAQQEHQVEVFKLDWKGNLICNYRLDRYAYTISLDSKEKKLFATCVDRTTNDVQIVSYNLE